MTDAMETTNPVVGTADDEAEGLTPTLDLERAWAGMKDGSVSEQEAVSVLGSVKSDCH
jgi:hypothetical protein